MRIIDLTETRKFFYEGFEKSIGDSNARVQQLVESKDFDLRVDYKRRENLPDEVRTRIKNPQPMRGDAGPGAAGHPTPSMFSLGEPTGAQRPDMSEWDTLVDKRRRYK